MQHRTRSKGDWLLQDRQTGKQTNHYFCGMSVALTSIGVVVVDVALVGVAVAGITDTGTTIGTAITIGLPPPPPPLPASSPPPPPPLSCLTSNSS